MTKQRIEAAIEITFQDAEDPTRLTYPALETEVAVTFLDVFPLTGWKQIGEPSLFVAETMSGAVNERIAKYGISKYCRAAYQNPPSVPAPPAPSHLGIYRLLGARLGV